VTVLIREAEIPIAIQNTTMYWDKVYRLVRPPVDSYGGLGLHLRTRPDDIYTDYDVPFKVAIAYMTSACIENGHSLIQFWRSIPDRANPEQYQDTLYNLGITDDDDDDDVDFDLKPMIPIISTK